jgi:hypothetical protein
MLRTILPGQTFESSSERIYRSTPSIRAPKRLVNRMHPLVDFIFRRRARPDGLLESVQPGRIFDQNSSNEVRIVIHIAIEQFDKFGVVRHPTFAPADMRPVRAPDGDPLFPNSVEAMRQLSGYMVAFGIAPEELDIMCIVNPAMIVGADPQDALRRAREKQAA